MSVKVVQGLVGAKAPESRQPVLEAARRSEQAVQQSGAAAQQASLVKSAISSEAVVATVKSHRIGGEEKLRNFKEAKHLTEEIAEQIRTTPGDSDPHGGLDALSAREHFSR